MPPRTSVRAAFGHSDTVKPTPVITKKIIFVTGGALLGAMVSFAQDLATNSKADGLFTSSFTETTAYQHSIALQDEKLQPLYSDGLDALRQKWVMPFLPGGPWGCGPLSNGEACVDYHMNSGRGQAPLAADEPMRSMLVRLSVPGKTPTVAPYPIRFMASN